ncbi:uncharacterized protein LOC105203311 [Solenopsis invicta]|uniref:uncharacterized protein LOC105203311 n=1 Tax=Solenopsis invicta TaxID=13686 RepID=UPI000595C888|nr:uncharacterized protein LOC105203311 [Solenopsis invicta]
MDDVLTGSDKLEEAISLQRQLTDLLAKGQFPLRKWRSNDDRILKHLAQEGITEELLVIHKKYTCAIENIRSFMEPSRGCSTIQRERDNIKSLPQELHSKWKNYQASWDQLRNLKIPRQIKDRDTTLRIIIHGFSDASERAYGACLYAVTRTLDGKFQSQLLCAKSRVVPLKVITIAKLELCAALLLAKLYKTVQEALGNKIADVQFWSDSTIVLGWIRTCPSTLKTFVANRVSQIQTLGSQHWLQEENSWPEQPSSVKELSEKKTVVSFVTTIQASEVLPSVSTFKRLIRIVAYCYRFGARCKSKVETGALTVAELTKAEAAVVRVVQREVFAQEYRDLQKGQQVKINSQLAALDPFLDSKDLICVGGRLQHSKLTEETKHPIVLPSKHQVTRLICKDEHVRLHHCGAE